jgi:F-type H+-transporting ATPase subunit delta
MRNEVLINRYAQGFLRSISNEKEFPRLHKQLLDFEQSVSEREKYEQIFMRPFIPTTQKVKLIKEIVKESGLDPKVARFLTLLVEKERLKILPDLVEKIPDLWHESRGLVLFEVASVIPLSEKQKKALQQKLEEMESAPAFLKFKIDPDLIGGLSLSKKNIIYDLSIRGSLTRMKEKISEG